MRRWYKYVEGSTAKQPVKLDDRVKQVSGTLIIKEAKVEDSGKYLCNVNNSVGGESVETVLTVTGKSNVFGWDGTRRDAEFDWQRLYRPTLSRKCRRSTTDVRPR